MNITTQEQIYKAIYSSKDKPNLTRIAKQFGTTRDIVRNIRINAGYYLDLTTGETVFYPKRVKEKQQVYYILYEHMEKQIEDRCSFVKRKDNKLYRFIDKKSLNVRLAKYLDISPRTCSYWNKKQRLVSEEIYSIKYEIAYEFEQKEIQNFRSFYSYNAYGFMRGYKLYFIDYYKRTGMNYYINNHALEYLQCELSDDKFMEKQMDEYLENAEDEGTSKELCFVVGISIKCGILLGKWLKGKTKQYSIREIERCLNSYRKYNNGEYEGTLIPPQAIYYETQGYMALFLQDKFEMHQQYQDGILLGDFNWLELFAYKEEDRLDSIIYSS